MQELTDDDYKKQLGLIGLQLMNLSKDKMTQVQQARRSNQSISGIGKTGVLETAVVEIDDSAFDNLVDRIRSSTLKVRIVGAFNDIVDPLYERLRIIQAENEQHEFQRHHEDSLYSDKMLTAIMSLESKNSSQNRGIYLATKEFMRHPMWNSLRFTLKALYETTKFTFGLAFGFKKKKSDTDRIVDAIKEQTEWHMTKSINQQKGFFSRLIQQGIVGMPLRGLANIVTDSLGVGRNTAQLNEDARARGESPSGIAATISDFLYSDVITRKGRLGNSSGESEPSPVHDNLLYEIIKQQMMENVHCCENTGRTIGTQVQLSRDMMRLDEQQYNRDREYNSKRDVLLIDMMRDQVTGVYEVAKHTKDTQKEVKKHRMQAFWMGMLNFGSNILKGVIGIGGRLLSVISSLLPLKGLAGLLGKLGTTIVSGVMRIVPALGALIGGGVGMARKGGKAIARGAGRMLERGKELGRAGMEKAGSIGRSAMGYGRSALGAISSAPKLLKGATVGGLIGLGGDYAADKLGRETKGGAAADVLGQTATYASTGALIGSIVPGVGTAVGAGVGGVIGAGKGLWDNRGTLFGQTTMEAQEETPVTMATEAAKQLAEDINKKAEETLKKMDEDKKLTTQMIEILKGIQKNTFSPEGEPISPLAGITSDSFSRYGR